MSLLDSLNVVTAPVSKNRVDLLLDKLEGEDLTTLQAALRNSAIRPFELTKALRMEYQDQQVVTDKSVADWRRAHISEVDGL